MRTIKSRLFLPLPILASLAQAGPPAKFVVDTAQRRFTFGAEHALQGARFGLGVDGETLWAGQAAHANWDSPSTGEISAGRSGRLALRFDAPGLEWTIEFQRAADGRSGLISSTIRNAGAAPLRLGRCRLADLSGPSSDLRLGPGAEKSVALVMSGWQAYSEVKTIRTAAKHLISKTLTELFNPASRAAIHLGFVTYDRATTVHELWWDDARQAPAASSYCDFEGFALVPGATIASETLGLRIDSDPFEGFDAWADAVRAHYNPRIWPKIPAGWVGRSWVDSFNVERYEDVVLRNAHAIRERLPGFDIEYIWVSIGNLQGRQPGNWLRWNRQLFPSGPQALVGGLKQLDFKLGLWCGAFWISSRLTEDIERRRDALLLKGGKPLTVPHRELGAVYVLDPTHPKTKEHLRRVFSTLREWGVRYYMIDFLDAISGTTPGNHVPDGYFDKSLIPGPQAYREGLKVIREAAGPDTYLLPSTGPTLLNVGLVDGNRVGTDYGEGRPLDGPGKGFYPATFLINRPEYWTSHRAATNALATHFFTHRKLFLADSGNVLTIDKPIPLADAQITATIFGINGSPVMLGNDIARMSDERLAIVRQVFPRLPEPATPLDLFETPAPDYPKLFHLKVRRGWDQWDLVAIFNYDGRALEQPLDFERLSLDSRASYVAWDFWSEKYLGIHTGRMTVSVPPQSVRLLRIARDRTNPWVLSTDMHVRQGQAEIVDCLWDAARMELNIEATRPAGCRGNVYVHVPKGLALKDPAGLWIAKDGHDDSLLVRCAFDFKGAPVKRVLAFIPIPALK